MFNPGDIIHLQFDPAAGKEMKGPRYGLVISLFDFNKTGLAYVMPITQGPQERARDTGLAVSLMGCGSQTQGVVLVHQAKSLDLRVRQARKVETIPHNLLDDILNRFRSLFPE